MNGVPSFFDATLEVVAPPVQCHVGERCRVPVRLTKRNPHSWPSGGDEPVRLSYHWLDSEGRHAIFDGLRTPLPPDIPEGRTISIGMVVQAPDAPGAYTLQVTLVRERVAWFEHQGFVPPGFAVTVVADMPGTSSSDGHAERSGPLRDRIHLAREQPRPYRTWEDYWCWSMVHRELHQPYGAPDLRVLDYLGGNAERLARLYGARPQDRPVSVIMPVFNRGEVVGSAIQSVLAQSYGNWELLVVDDHSVDGTAEAVTAFDDPRIRLVRRDENGGVSAARNTGLAQARGEYIAYLDSDNLWQPHFLLLMVNALADATWARAVYCAQRVVRRLGGEMFESIRFGPFNRALLENENYIDINAFLHHRSLLQEVGVFDERLRSLEDWQFVLRCTASTPPLALAAVLSDYRYDDAGDHTVDRHPPNWERVDAVLRDRSFQLPLSGAGPAPPPARQYTFFVNGPLRRAARTRFVSIVIPSYEAAEYLSCCLQALVAFTEPGSFEVIVVDNASSSPVTDLLERYRDDPAFRVILNDRNLGFSQAVNQGIDAARLDADVVLLNNDALVTPGWLDALREVAEVEARAGIVVPRQVLLPGTPTFWEHVPGCNPDREIDVSLSAHHRNVLNPVANPALGIVELTFAPFFCVYLTRECLERAGALDVARGPHYHSDQLYCDLVRNGAGLRVLYTPHAKVYHFLQRATADLRSRDPGEYHRIFLEERLDTAAPADHRSGPAAGSAAERGRPAPIVPGTSYQPLDAIRPLSAAEASTARAFTAMYCELWNLGRPGGRGTMSVGWLGHLAQKCPLDLWIYQELIVETRPDLIIECGTRFGGSALYLASICQLLGRGRVVTVDVTEERQRPVHSLITYVHGSSVAPDIVDRVTDEATRAGRVMVILDSDHSRDHVLAELHAYADLVTPGCYLIVEDSVVNGHPFWADFGPGPMEAIDIFLAGRPDFEIDPVRERFMVTLNPRGYLRRLPERASRAEGPRLDATGRGHLDDLKRRLIDLDGVALDDGTRFVNDAEPPRSLEERRRVRIEGRDWPARALTMAGLKRLDQLQDAIETVVADGVPGDVVETGVWRGGACILARRVLQALHIRDRRVWLADSFQGLPVPRPEIYPADAGDLHHEHDYLRVALETVRDSLQAFGVLDDQVRFLPGWFAETLPASPIEQIAVLRLDGDMYESTHVALESLYPRVAAGGYVIVDDYGAVPACRLAVREFRQAHGITAPLQVIDWTGRYWRVPVRFQAAERARLASQAAADDSSHLDLWPGHLHDGSGERCEAARRALDGGDPHEARRLIEEILAAEPNSLPAHLLLARLTFTGPDYYDVLREVHRIVRPRSYVELGVFKGESLRLAAPACRVIGVDPRPLVEPPVPPRAHLFAVGSHQFFAEGFAERWLGGEAFDVAFVDASHHFADALLDFMGLERFAHRGSIVLLHDTMPTDARVADPERTTTFYTGDVWKVVAALRALRPELDIHTVPCPPSGLTIIRGLDPASPVLWDGLDECLARFASLPFSWFQEHREEILGLHDGAVEDLLSIWQR